MQETWLGNDADLSGLHIDGYQLIHKGKTASEHGGLAVYIENKFNYEIIDNNYTSDKWEFLHIKITCDEFMKPLILGNIYRPPRNVNNNYNLFTREFSDINQTKSSNYDIIYAGTITLTS